MSWTLAPIVLALAAAASSRTAPQITHTEGAVSIRAGDIRSAGGRAEARLADGTLLHVDRETDVSIWDPYTLSLAGGRILIRTSAGAFIDVNLPIARVQLAPRGVYGILYDRTRDSLLVNVAVGFADIHTRHGTTQVAGREMAVMMGPSSRPYPTPYEPARYDSFEQWSDRRMTMLADGSGVPARGPEPAYPGGDRASDGAGECSTLSYDNPCWIVSPPVGIPPAPGYTPTLPGYAPAYQPDYAPRYDVRPEPHPGVRPGSRPDGDRPERRAEPPPKPPGARVPRIVTPPPSPAPPPPAAATPKPAGGTAVRPPRS